MKHKITLSEDEIVALANLYTTLIENQPGLESIRDALDESSDPQSLWAPVEYALPALRALLKQLPM